MNRGFFIDEAWLPMYMWAGMMKRLTTIVLSIGLVLALAAPSFAIDAKKKSASTTAPAEPAKPTADTSRVGSVGASAGASPSTSSKSLLERLKSDVRESSQKSDTGKYDNYIDSNNDGVDDRVKEKKATAEPEQQKVKTATPTKDTTPRARTKKKPG